MAHQAELDVMDTGNVEKTEYLHEGARDGELAVGPDSILVKADPLNWPLWQKVYIAGLVSLLAFVAQMSSAMINPAYVSMSKDLGITVPQASYCTTVYILFGGITPMASQCLRPQESLHSAPSYGGIIVGRVFNGIGSSIPLGIGASTICDLFVQGERGLYMGIYTLSVTNGPHIAPIIGGYITQSLGWRWCIWIPAIIQSFLWVLLCFNLPETLYSRGDASNLVRRSYKSKLLFCGKVLNRPIRLRDFGTSFRMTKYLAVTLPCIYYMTANTYGSALFAVTGAQIGSSVYHFDTAQIGLLMGVPLSVGCMIGEATAGWVSDVIINAYARRHNGYRKPEARLFLVPLCTLLCIGTATYGYCIEHKSPWIASSICMAISGIGTQVGTTVVYTYCTDSYKPQSGEIVAIINLFKSVFAFNIGFYALPLSQSIGFDAGFGTLAAINGLTILPIVFLIFTGEKIREWQGTPKEHEDL